MGKLALKDLYLKNKKVLLRVDFNVPLGKNFLISEDSRIVAALPTIKYILNQGAALILISHLGRPKGKFQSDFSLRVCAERLKEKLNKEVLLAPDCIGEKVEKMKKDLKPGQVLMLENVRFYPEETAKERTLDFAKELAKECDYYVNDAFGCCHRSQASIVDLPLLFEKKAAMGFLLEKEVNYFEQHVFNPKRPFVAIIGGSKISTKIGILKSLASIADTLLIGGAMAHTFLKAKGYDLKGSLVEDEYLELAQQIMDECQKKNLHLVLPKDIVFAEKLEPHASYKAFNLEDKAPENWVGVDIGEQTIKLFQSYLKHAHTVLWNGPLGIFEVDPFSNGTRKVAEIVSEIDATTIIGGGDSAAAVKQMGLEAQFDHISTGGGASLEFIEKKHLLGVDALSNKD